MCGISGLYSECEDAQNLDIKWIRRRGPDASGYWRANDVNVQLSHVRLSILDPSDAGNQPMITKNKRVVMVFNGEIFNFLELRSELKSRGVEFKGLSDSEVLLNLFALDGVSCFNRLNGIFAAAFWEQDKKILTLVRDPVGVKPLYYSNNSGKFYFSSELKVLIRSGAIKPTLRPSSVLNYVSFLWSPGEDTLINEAKKVLPGHVIQIKSGRIISDKSYRPLHFKKPLISGSLDDVVKSVQESLRIAVERQMLSDAPLGAFLSGGLDSSTVVSYAQQHKKKYGTNLSDRFQCFSIELEKNELALEGFALDLPYAKRAAKHLDVDLNVVRAGSDMMDRLPEMLYFMDEPCPDPAALNTLLIAELARSQGIKVLLSGAGGDDIFTGYRRHYAIRQERWWSGLPLSFRKSLSDITQLLPSSFPLTRRVSKAFRYAFQDDDYRLISYFLWTDPTLALDLFHPEFRNELTYKNLYGPMLKTLSHLDPNESSLNRMLYLDCKHFLADHNLNYTDKMGMAAGVEIRVPLLDLNLIDLANSLPIDMKQNGRIGKWIFKKSMEKLLPYDIIYRPKTGFGVPLRHWLTTILKPLVDDTLSDKSLINRGIFNPSVVHSMRQADQDGKIDAAYTIFSLVCLELWCRQYIDGSFAIDINT